MKAKILEVDFSNDTAVIKFEGDYSIRNVEYEIYETPFIKNVIKESTGLSFDNRELKEEIENLINKNKELTMEIESKRPKITSVNS